MTAFTESYAGLLIQQYFTQPNAAAEISAQAATWEKVRDIIVDFQTEFDLDTATGDRLDKIGKLVGLPRSGRIEFTDDNEYRFFLRLQIAINNGSAFMVNDDRASIQSVIQFAFDKLAYALDNKDMTLTLYVSRTFSVARLLLILELGLLPKPQGVRYVVIMYEDPDLPFGFSELGQTDPTEVDTYSELGAPDWVQVGNGLGIPGVFVSALAALSATEVVYIDNSDDELRTYRFDGTDWAQVGNGLPVLGGAYALAALNGTEVVLASGNNDELRTYRFDGTDWAQVGNTLVIAALGSSALATLNATDVALIDDGARQLRTYRFDGTDWAQVGNGLAIIGGTAPALAALNGTDVVYIETSFKSLGTYRFDGTDWAQVGNRLAIADVTSATVAALSATEIAFIDNTNDELRTYSFDGTDWAQVGTGLVIPGTSRPALATLNGTDVAFIDDVNDELRTYRRRSGEFGGRYSELYEEQ